MKLALIMCLLGATAVGQSANKKRKQRKRTRQGSNARQTALRNKLTTPASTTNPIRVRSFTKKTILVKNPVMNLHDEHPNLFQKVAINTNGNARQEPNNLQHCFKCEVTIQPTDSANVDPWLKCMMEGALVECTGMDRSCETVERRWDKKVNFVGMGCKQRNSCMQSVPDWSMNSGQCNPHKKGNSWCVHCCDNTVPSGNRGCNLDGWDKRKLGLQENWNVNMTFQPAG